MLQYRLGTVVALVLASPMEHTSVSENVTFTIERIIKVSAWAALKAASGTEWETDLTTSSDDHAGEYPSPLREYWDRDAKRLLRMVFET